MAGMLANFGEWEVVLVIITLVGFIKVFMDASSKWTKAITELSVIVDQLAKCVDEFKDNNAKTHERIFDQLDDHTETLSQHDKRISILENNEMKEEH